MPLSRTKCAKCGHTVKKHAKFCAQCGQQTQIIERKRSRKPLLAAGIAVLAILVALLFSRSAYGEKILNDTWTKAQEVLNIQHSVNVDEKETIYPGDPIITYSQFYDSSYSSFTSTAETGIKMHRYRVTYRGNIQVSKTEIDSWVSLQPKAAEEIIGTRQQQTYTRPAPIMCFPNAFGAQNPTPCF